MLSELDRVVLTQNVPEEGLEAGDVGTIVHIYRGGEAFEVEFFALDGDTVAVVTATVDQVRPVTCEDVTHARRRAVPA